MRVGLPRELLSLEPVSRLKRGLDRAVADVEWVHDGPSRAITPRYLGQDACFPVKKMLASCLALAPGVDVLLVPRLKGVEGHLLCPNFRALPDLVSLNRDRMETGGEAVLEAPLLEGGREKDLRALVERTAQRILGHAPEGTRSPGPAPEKPAPLPEDLSGSVALLGHAYVLDDDRLNNGVKEILHRLGAETVRGDQVPYPTCDRLARDRDYFAKTLYWRPAREVLGAFLYFTRVQRPAGIIHLVPFNCGIEALVRLETRAIHGRMDNPPPYMVVVCDEHTQRDHVSTRVEAFLDMVYGF